MFETFGVLCTEMTLKSGTCAGIGTNALRDARVNIKQRNNVRCATDVTMLV
jgi:hypothetical protein